MPEEIATHDRNIGRVIADKYRIDAVVGTGATGSVYRATHLVLERNVALKVLNPTLVANPNAKARFRREARAASKLEHPNSVQVFDYGIEPDGLTYLAMELLDGRELFKVIYDDWPLSSERIVKILSQVLSVLAAAHDIGIVHRDLKPENIMLVTRPGDDGRPTEMVKVTDFGIAKSIETTEESLNLTRDGTLHGTPEYMSPEQARGDKVDGRSDLYAVGVILYEMLVGALPFAGENPFDIILKQLTEPIPEPSSKRMGIDRRFDSVVLCATAKDRDRRYPDARAMRAALLEANAPIPLEVQRPTLDPGSASVPVPLVAQAPSPLLLTSRRPPAQREEPAATPGDAPSSSTTLDEPAPLLAPKSLRTKPQAQVTHVDDGPPPVVPGHSPVRNFLVTVGAIGALIGLFGAAGLFLWRAAHSDSGTTATADAGSIDAGVRSVAPPTDARPADAHAFDAGRPDAARARARAPSNAPTHRAPR